MNAYSADCTPNVYENTIKGKIIRQKTHITENENVVHCTIQENRAPQMVLRKPLHSRLDFLDYTYNISYDSLLLLSGKDKCIFICTSSACYSNGSFLSLEKQIAIWKLPKRRKRGISLTYMIFYICKIHVLISCKKENRHYHWTEK